MSAIEEGGGLTKAGEKITKSRLRTVFIFVRNNVMHNCLDMPRDEAMALVLRIAGLIEEVREIQLPGESLPLWEP